MGPGRVGGGAGCPTGDALGGLTGWRLAKWQVKQIASCSRPIPHVPAFSCRMICPDKPTSLRTSLGSPQDPARQKADKEVGSTECISKEGKRKGQKETPEARRVWNTPSSAHSLRLHLCDMDLLRDLVLYQTSALSCS